MSKPDRIFSNRLSFVPPLATGNAVQIQVPNELEIHATNTQFVGGVDLGPRAKFTELDDYAGNRVMFMDPDVDRRIEYDSAVTVDFNACTVLGLSGVGGGSVDAQAVASNNSNPSSGSAYGTVDAELDDIQTRVSANTTRTTGLTASKILVSNAAGVLSTGSFDATDIVRKSVSTGQTLGGPLTVGGEINIPSGESYKINSVALASTDLSDGTTLSKIAADETLSGNKNHTAELAVTGTDDVILNKAITIQQFDLLGGSIVAGSGVEYTTQQGCIKASDAVVLTNSKFTDNASDRTGKTAANGFLRVSNGATGEVVNTGEVCMADGSLTQTIGGNKTFSSSVTIGDGATNAFISAGGYLQLTTPSGTNGQIKFNKAGSVHTLTMNDVGTAADNLSFDANFNLTAGNTFKIDGAQLQSSNLSDGGLLQKENTSDMKLTDTTYKQFAEDATDMNGGCGFLQVIEETSGLVRNSAKVVRADGGVNQSIDGEKTFTSAFAAQSN